MFFHLKDYFNPLMSPAEMKIKQRENSDNQNVDNSHNFRQKVGKEIPSILESKSDLEKPILVKYCFHRKIL